MSVEVYTDAEVPITAPVVLGAVGSITHLKLKNDGAGGTQTVSDVTLLADTPDVEFSLDGTTGWTTTPNVGPVTDDAFTDVYLRPTATQGSGNTSDVSRQVGIDIAGDESSITPLPPGRYLYVDDVLVESRAIEAGQEYRCDEVIVRVGVGAGRTHATWFDTLTASGSVVDDFNRSGISPWAASPSSPGPPTSWSAEIATDKAHDETHSLKLVASRVEGYGYSSAYATYLFDGPQTDVGIWAYLGGGDGSDYNEIQFRHQGVWANLVYFSYFDFYGDAYWSFGGAESHASFAEGWHYIRYVLS